MEDLGKKHENRKLYSDNQSAFHIANKSSFHSKTKHIQLRYNFIQSVLENGQLKLENIHTSQNPIDMLNKVVTREKLISDLVSVVLIGKMRIFPSPELEDSLVGIVAVELMLSASKWEIVGCGA